jgi:hypothetical protein
MEVVRAEFTPGIDALHKKKPIRAIFLGTRMGDPNMVGFLPDHCFLEDFAAVELPDL